MSTSLRLLFAFGLCVFYFPASAQPAGKLESRGNLAHFPFTISLFGTKNNIPQSQIDDIIQDPETGDLLFTTAEGILRYDGYVFSTTRNRTETKNKIFTRLFYSDTSRKLYGIIPEVGLCEIGDTIKFLRALHWADQTDGSLVSIDRYGLVRLERSNSDRSIIQATKIIQPNYLIQWKGRLIISNEEGAYCFDLVNKKKVQISQSSIVNHFITTEGQLLLILRDRLLQFDSVEGSFTLIYKVSDKNIRFTDAQYFGDALLITSDRGLFMLQGNGIQHFTSSDYLPTNKLNCIYRERYSGCFFIGTGDKGLIRLEPKSGRAIYSANPAFQGGYASVLQLSNGQFVSASDRSIVRLDLPPEATEIAQLPVKAASLATYDGRLLVGAWGSGLSAFDIRSGRVVDEYLPGQSVVATYRDRKNQYWVASTRMVYTGSSLDSLMPFQTDTINKHVICFYETRDGRLLIGGFQGVFILRANRKIERILDASVGYDAKEVRSFLEDEAGRIWIGTYGGGLFCYDRGKLISLSKKKNYGLGMDIFTLAKTKSNDLLITSNNGIRRFRFKALVDFYEGRSDYLLPYIIHENNGIYNAEFNGGFQNNYATKDQSIFYFPTIQGCFEYDSRVPLGTHGPIRIQELWVDGVAAPRNLSSIERSARELRIRFASASFSESINTQYQYQLFSPDKKGEWSDLQKNTEVVLSNLGPGQYMFQVRAVGAGDEGLASVSVLSFSIQPFFYETWWFRILVFFLVAGSLFFLLLNRLRATARRREEKNRLDRQLQKLRIQALHAQMNPHFLFNSMNLVNHLISAGKHLEAQQVVVDFSRLLRKILSTNESKFNSINEEIEIIRYYLGIQLYRFNHKLDYDIRLPELLKPVQIPSMILQPLVENAIIHGIAHLKDRKGVLLISFQDLGSHIEIKVQDNGVGRKESARINAGRQQHTSVGNQLIQNKIQLLRDEFNLSIDLTYEDIEVGNECGTIVTLKCAKYDSLSDRGG